MKTGLYLSYHIHLLISIQMSSAYELLIKSFREELHLYWLETSVCLLKANFSLNLLRLLTLFNTWHFCLSHFNSNPPLIQHFQEEQTYETWQLMSNPQWNQKGMVLEWSHLMQASRWCETPPSSPHAPFALINITCSDTSNADVNSSPAGRCWERSDGLDFR